ncbi:MULTISPECIES: hypothetical protein [unclassified Kitasatospora]|uniref:hypothetical protein n=1 Tax=unclassified Kitasatospora TaxID=2633591 RepID=UPI00070C08FF|nr:MULTISPECIES: hypothetical protein [unclassified Kitasatospora]KQV22940.1 hypothetical protein ASC99_17540 [Kitasatospora sp. Root107]
MELAVETVQMTEQQVGPPVVRARTRVRHWVLVAAATAAVIAGALAVNPAQGTVRPIRPAAPSALPAAVAPDPAKAVLPLDCGPLPTTVALSFGAVLDGRPSTVVAAHCAAENGTPPDGVFLLTPGQDGRPQIAATLVKPEEGLTVTELKLRSDGTITARGRGYSSDEIPRYAPDLTVLLSWHRQGGDWLRSRTTEPATKV